MIAKATARAACDFLSACHTFKRKTSVLLLQKNVGFMDWETCFIGLLKVLPTFASHGFTKM